MPDDFCKTHDAELIGGIHQVSSEFTKSRTADTEYLQIRLQGKQLTDDSGGMHVTGNLAGQNKKLPGQHQQATFDCIIGRETVF
jgi:hypothetical protein